MYWQIERAVMRFLLPLLLLISLPFCCSCSINKRLEVSYRNRPIFIVEFGFKCCSCLSVVNWYTVLSSFTDNTNHRQERIANIAQDIPKIANIEISAFAHTLRLERIIFGLLYLPRSLYVYLRSSILFWVGCCFVGFWALCQMRIKKHSILSDIILDWTLFSFK